MRKGYKNKKNSTSVNGGESIKELLEIVMSQDTVESRSAVVFMIITTLDIDPSASISGIKKQIFCRSLQSEPIQQSIKDIIKKDIYKQLRSEEKLIKKNLNYNKEDLSLRRMLDYTDIPTGEPSVNKLPGTDIKYYRSSKVFNKDYSIEKRWTSDFYSDGVSFHEIINIGNDSISFEWRQNTAGLIGFLYNESISVDGKKSSKKYDIRNGESDDLIDNDFTLFWPDFFPFNLLIAIFILLPIFIINLFHSMRIKFNNLKEVPLIPNINMLGKSEGKLMYTTKKYVKDINELSVGLPYSGFAIERHNNNIIKILYKIEDGKIVQSKEFDGSLK